MTGRDYEVRLQSGSDWVEGTIRCELVAAAGAVKPADATGGTTELEARQKDLLEVQEDADRRRVLYDSTRKLSDAEFVATLEGMARAPSTLTSLQSDIARQEGARKSLLQQGYGSQNPRVQALDAQLGQERNQYSVLVTGERNALKIDADMAASGVALLQEKVDELKAAQNRH